MSTEVTKLWNKKFIMFVMGMEFYLIGLALLHFALPVYILLETSNPALMGTVLAFSSLTFMVFSPIGGVMADRFNYSSKILILHCS